jgi:hypothetical protein
MTGEANKAEPFLLHGLHAKQSSGQSVQTPERA